MNPLYSYIIYLALNSIKLIYLSKSRIYSITYAQISYLLHDSIANLVFTPQTILRNNDQRTMNSIIRNRQYQESQEDIRNQRATTDDKAER